MAAEPPHLAIFGGVHPTHKLNFHFHFEARSHIFSSLLVLTIFFLHHDFCNSLQQDCITSPTVFSAATLKIPVSVKMKFFISILLLISTSVLAIPTGMPVIRTKGNSSPSTCTGGSGTTNNAGQAAPSNGAPSNGTTGGGGNASGNIDPSLVPDFGVAQNVNANAKQQGSCDGFNAASNSVVLISCSCPPSRATFLAALNKNVAAGSVQGDKVTFNNDASDQSAATNKQRATAMLVTLQNLNGAGVGCPAASAPNFAVQQKTGAVSSKAFVQ